MFMSIASSLSTFTQKKHNWLDYKLLNESDLRLAINKLGKIEDFEKIIHKPILDYISELHADHMELRKRNAAVGAVIVAGKAFCPYCGMRVTFMMNYCSDCGQALYVGKEIMIDEVKQS